MVIYAIITFHSTHFALKAKKMLLKNGKKPEMIPVPREFSSDCGFCCQIPWEEKNDVQDILRQHSVEVDQIFRWEKDEERKKKKP